MKDKRIRKKGLKKEKRREKNKKEKQEKKKNGIKHDRNEKFESERGNGVGPGVVYDTFFDQPEYFDVKLNIDREKHRLFF